MNKILITGATSFIVSHVVRSFVKNYQDIHVFNFNELTYT